MFAALWGEIGYLGFTFGAIGWGYWGGFWPF